MQLDGPGRPGRHYAHDSARHPCRIRSPSLKSSALTETGGLGGGLESRQGPAGRGKRERGFLLVSCFLTIITTTTHLARLVLARSRSRSRSRLVSCLVSTHTTTRSLPAYFYKQYIHSCLLHPFGARVCSSLRSLQDQHRARATPESFPARARPAFQDSPSPLD